MALTMLTSVALALAVQSYTAPPPSPGANPLPGIVEPSGGARLRGPVTVRFEDNDEAFRRDLREARREVDRRRRRGEISRSEAQRLRREVAVIDRLAERYRRDGISAAERSELEVHARTLRTRSAVTGGGAG